MASEIVAVVTCVAEFTVAPIVKQVKYVLDYQQNMTNLPKEVEKLMDLKQEIEGLVSSARRNAEDIKHSVGDWMKEADQIVEAARQMIREEEEQSKKRCFIGLCPNPVSRHRSSRKAFKETVQILRVQTAGKEFKEGSVSFPVSAVPSFPVTVTLDKDFLDFNSRSKTWEEIMKALKDPHANVIGVYGMGGLGKTTLVKQVAARAVEQKLFDEVIVPVVTQNNVLDTVEFQEEMAKVLNMKLDDQWNQWNVLQRADRIFKRLTQKTGDEKMEKKTIVILDDLRTKLDLEQVGIPSGAGIKGCKILFTSRFRYVSYDAQKTVTLGVLVEEEPWSLFKKLAGGVLENPSFFDIGKEVTQNCKGLPILIVTVAGALLRRRSLGAWKDALIRLQREGSKEMQEFVDSALEFISFNHLSDANKSLFLLCGLLGGGEISIFDQLLKLGIGWGLFEHKGTVEEARNNLETLIHDLKASFLLLDGQSVDSVRMHDVVRDVAIKIARKEDHNMLLRSSEEWCNDDMLNRCIALTFPYGIASPLPECLLSPSLEFLLLYHNHSMLKIPDNLFEKMQKLTVLDIRSVDLFPKLPSSLAFLENLHTLSLNLCKLRDISIVGVLKKLTILSLNSTGIVVLPMEIGGLSELRVLDLNGCSELKVIPSGIIQRLSRLEELHMAKSFSQWEAKGLGSSERRNASLDELKYLVNLTTLRIHIPNAKLIPKDFYFEKLERFTILIGDDKWEWSCHDEQSLYRFRGMKVKVNGNRNIYMEAGVQEMLKRTEILYLDGMENIHELEWKLFQELKFVHIQHSGETHYILNSMQHRTQDRPFPVILESLFLNHLSQLQYLCTSKSMVESSFSKLKFVDVTNCNRLRNLFSFSMARGLMHLEEVKVTDCDSLEAIVEDTREVGKNGDTVMDKLEFRQLRFLILERLPKLSGFGNSVRKSSIFPNRRKLVTTDHMKSDEISSEDGCTIVAPFFNEKVLFPKLAELTLNECDNVDYLFNQSIVMSLEQLNFITIKNCKSLKGIVAHLEGEETNETIKFPKLINLFLGELPCLIRFCSGCSIVFPMLTRLWIRRCRQLKTFVREDKTVTNKMLSTAIQPLFNEKVELPKLKSLLLWWVDNVKTIWHNHLHEDSFFKLEQVDVSGCPNLSKIFPSTMLTRIQSLEKLRLWNNCLVEEVFESDELTRPNISQGGGTTEDDKINFSQLRCLELIKLSNLKRFCSGSCVVFPALTQLEIWDCKQIETFMYPITVINSTRKAVEDMDSTDMQPLFNEKVEFPSLKELELGNLDNVKIIWDSRIHEDYMGQPGLASIVQGLVSFKFLTELEVYKCDGLVQFSTAKNLVQLTRLKVTACQTVKEIVASESADGAEDEIVFDKLKTLELCKLPSLVNFYLGSCILKFPSLEKVRVEWCNNMKAFCGGITITPKLKTLSLTRGKMDFEVDKEDKDLNTIIKEAQRLATEYATSSSKHLSEAEDDICENSNQPRTNDKIVIAPVKKSEISSVIAKQDRRAETCEDAVNCSEGVADKATKSSVEAESSEKVIQSKKNYGICEKIIELGKEVHTYDKAMEPNDYEAISSRKEAYKVDDEGVELSKGGAFCEEIVEPRKEVTKERDESKALPRPYLVKGSLGPTLNTIDATCPSSQSHPALGSGVGATICQQNNEFQGLQVTQHLVRLLEKARDKHGDFHTSPWIKLKTVRIIAMETVGQVLHILQTQTPRTINAENIQFMEDAFHDLSTMRFPIEWLHPLIDKASKCLLSIQRRTVVYELKAKIDEMEAQLQMLRGEMEVENAKLEEFDEENGFVIDLDQPLLDI